jgi:anthranilate/para-aminobenzoate synthase component I
MMKTNHIEVTELHSQVTAVDLVHEMRAQDADFFLYSLSPSSGENWFLFAPLTDHFVIYEDRIIRSGKNIEESDFNNWLEASARASYTSTREIPFRGGVLFAAGFEFSRIWDRTHQCLRLKKQTNAETQRPRGIFSAPKDFLLVSPDAGKVLRCTVDGVKDPHLEELCQSIVTMKSDSMRSAEPRPRSASPRLAFPYSDYTKRFASLRDFFEKGEVYQVITPAVFRAPSPSPTAIERMMEVSREYYRQAPFSYIASVCGELFFGFCALPNILMNDDVLETCVFAGTLPTPKDEEELRQCKKRFNSDESFIAEHIMLVDFERNDFNQLCDPSTVECSELLSFTTIGSTMYLSTTVKGRRRSTSSLIQCALSTIPRGVVSGAPRQRACEVIAELEGKPRGWYGGAIGIIESSTQSIRSNCIVTCVIVSDELEIPVGSGVLVDSNLQEQIEELYCKATKLLEFAETQI